MSSTKTSLEAVLRINNWVVPKWLYRFIALEHEVVPSPLVRATYDGTPPRLQQNTTRRYRLVFPFGVSTPWDEECPLVLGPPTSSF